MIIGNMYQSRYGWEQLWNVWADPKDGTEHYERIHDSSMDQDEVFQLVEIVEMHDHFNNKRKWCKVLCGMKLGYVPLTNNETIADMVNWSTRFKEINPES